MTLEIKREVTPVAEMIPIIRVAVENGKPVEMTVTGSSMMPLLIDRVSSVRMTKPDDLKRGDIVLFLRSDGHYVLHRIARVQDGSYDIIGDNQWVADRNVLQKDIIAKVMSYSRDGKHWKESDSFYQLLLPALKTIRHNGYRVKRKLSSIVK